jgi:hypothetical protein
MAGQKADSASRVPKLNRPSDLKRAIARPQILHGATSGAGQSINRGEVTLQVAGP